MLLLFITESDYQRQDHVLVTVGLKAASLGLLAPCSTRLNNIVDDKLQWIQETR